MEEVRKQAKTNSDLKKKLKTIARTVHDLHSRTLKMNIGNVKNPGYPTLPGQGFSWFQTFF
jgi:hypothetical protein